MKYKQKCPDCHSFETKLLENKTANNGPDKLVTKKHRCDSCYTEFENQFLQIEETNLENKMDDLNQKLNDLHDAFLSWATWQNRMEREVREMKEVLNKKDYLLSQSLKNLEAIQGMEI